MQPACETLRAELEAFLPDANPPALVAFLSSVTGKKRTQPIDVNYWVDHLVQPVRFFDVIKELSNHKIDLAIEVGPSPHLTAMIERASRADADHVNYAVVSTFDPKSDDFTQWSRAIASSWCMGADVDWRKLADQYPRHRRRVTLPNYPFQRSRYWLEPEAIGSRTGGGNFVHPLLGSKQTLIDGSLVFTSTIRSSDPNYLADHVVSGSVTVPGSAWIETMRAAAAQRFPAGFLIKDLKLERAVFLEEYQAVSVQCRVIGQNHLAKIEVAFQIPSGEESDDNAWQTCAIAKAQSVTLGPLESIAEPIDGRDVDVDELYEQLAQRDLEYGEFFRVLQEITADEEAVSASIILPEPLESDADQYFLHPTLLDGCFHLFAVIFPNDQRTFLPVGVDQIRFADLKDLESKNPVRAIVRSQRDADDTGNDDTGNDENSTADTVVADVVLFNAQQQPIALLSGVRMQSLQRHRSVRLMDPAAWNFKLDWTPIVEPTNDSIPGPMPGLGNTTRVAVWTTEPFCSGYERRPLRENTRGDPFTFRVRSTSDSGRIGCRASRAHVRWSSRFGHRFDRPRFRGGLGDGSRGDQRTSGVAIARTGFSKWLLGRSGRPGNDSEAFR